ncbi:MAG: stage III sporulation protein AB [Clostridia bacterium]
MKLFASALIILCGYFLGVFYASERRKEYDALCEMISLLKYLKNKIDTTNLNIFEIISSFEGKILAECGFIAEFSTFTSRVSASRVWKSAVQKLIISDTLKSECFEFGETLGLLDRHTQTERIESLCVSLLEKQKEMKEENIKRQKFSGALGTLGGTLLVIMFL